MLNIGAFQESHTIKARMSVYVKSYRFKKRCVSALQEFLENIDVRFSTDVFGH